MILCLQMLVSEDDRYLIFSPMCIVYENVQKPDNHILERETGVSIDAHPTYLFHQKIEEMLIKMKNEQKKKEILASCFEFTRTSLFHVSEQVMSIDQPTLDLETVIEFVNANPHAVAIAARSCGNLASDATNARRFAA